MFSRQYQCADCGGFEGYRSRRRNLLEKYILPLLMLQPVRCASCYRRTHVSMFAPLARAGAKTFGKRASRRLIVAELWCWIGFRSNCVCLDSPLY